MNDTDDLAATPEQKAAATFSLDWQPPPQPTRVDKNAVWEAIWTAIVCQAFFLPATWLFCLVFGWLSQSELHWPYIFPMLLFFWSITELVKALEPIPVYVHGPTDEERARVKQQLEELITKQQQTAAEEGIELGTATLDGYAELENHGVDTTLPLILPNAIRNRHTYLIGKTRTGKTTLLKEMILQDMESGAGLAYIDPHGDAADELLELVPEHRTQDVIYYDPTGRFCDTPRFNPFELPYPPAKLAEDIISVFRLLVGSSWGPRMEHILRFGVLTFLLSPKAYTLRDLRTLYIDSTARERVIADVTNEGLLEFWLNEFPQIPISAVNPILNKLSAFLAPTSDLERVFSSPENDLDFTDILDSRKILIINLSKGLLGSEPATLLGGMLITAIQQAALARAAVSMQDRPDFYLYVDEFQNFTVASFDTILSEAAKYRLNLTIAHQNMGQLSNELRRSIFGNCGTLISYQVSADDAPVLKKEMHKTTYSARPEGSSRTYSLKALKAEIATTAERLNPNTPTQTPNRKRKKIETADQAQRTFNTIVARLPHERSHNAQLLAALDEDPPSLKTLKDLFPTYEFTQTTFPDITDFVTMPPYHAFARMGTASNVIRFKARAPTRGNPENREAVRQAMKRYQRLETGPKPTLNQSSYDSDFSPIEDED